MATCKVCGIVIVLICLLRPAAAQAPKAPQADEAAERAKIFESDCWRRAMFELDNWSRTQTIYRPEELARMRADFAEQVKTMSTRELREVIANLDTKFKLLNSPQLAETRAWFAQYMAVLSDRRRDEILKEIPNFATMTAAELQQTILKVQRKISSQAQFNRARQTKVDKQVQRNQANLAAQVAARQRRASQSAYRSPYRPAAPAQSRFDNVQLGSSRTMMLDPGGGLWMNLNF
jgi:hypothetical protein